MKDGEQLVALRKKNGREVGEGGVRPGQKSQWEKEKRKHPSRNGGEGGKRVSRDGDNDWDLRDANWRSEGGGR